jgi:hypothetical protein
MNGDFRLKWHQFKHSVYFYLFNNRALAIASIPSNITNPGKEVIGFHNVF